MKKKEIQELRQQTVEQLKKLVSKIIVELVKIRQEVKIGKVKNIYQMTKKRCQLAILKTILREKELNESS